MLLLLLFAAAVDDSVWISEFDFDLDLGIDSCIKWQQMVVVVVVVGLFFSVFLLFFCQTLNFSFRFVLFSFFADGN